jgi:hypothetical protein
LTKGLDENKKILEQKIIEVKDKFDELNIEEEPL